MATIDFWFSIGSTYSYLTVMRLPGVARATGHSFRWRPFNVRHVMVSQNNIPFKDKPEKTAYMWRDIQRRAAGYGLRPTVPAPYPLCLALCLPIRSRFSAPWKAGPRTIPALPAAVGLKTASPPGKTPTFPPPSPRSGRTRPASCNRPGQIGSSPRWQQQPTRRCNQAFSARRRSP